MKTIRATITLITLEESLTLKTTSKLQKRVYLRTNNFCKCNVCQRKENVCMYVLYQRNTFYLK